MKTIYPVLLCGGTGTRLWPLSRKSYPKQFAKLIGDESLFQSSARRVSGEWFEPPLVVTASDFRFVVVEQLAALHVSPSDILIEPAMRDTAAAVCAAALTIEEKDPGSLMLVLPSDHLIKDEDAFHAAVRVGVTAAKEGQLVTLGVQPDRAETGYGWIELTSKPDFSPVAQPVRSLTEKPDREQAEQFLAGKKHLWNAGIFLFSTSTIINAFEENAPETLALVREARELAVRDLGFTRLDPPAWDRLDNISIDYAIMENVGNLSVVPYPGDWSDLGDWNSVWRASDADEDGNVSNGTALVIDCRNSLLHATNDAQQVVGIGLDDVIAVAMPDAVLVAQKDHAQDLKKAVDHLKKAGVAQAETSSRFDRPWGWFEVLETGPHFQVKRVSVKPAGALSLQSHHHRAEHWIIVEGTAKVTIGDEAQLLTQNQSIYVPLGVVHRLENPGKVPLTLIEVQTGAYLSEDDIVRYEDIYSRQENRVD